AMVEMKTFDPLIRIVQQADHPAGDFDNRWVEIERLEFCHTFSPARWLRETQSQRYAVACQQRAILARAGGPFLTILTASPPTVQKGTRPAMPQEINVGLIGYKFMGKAHSNAYRTVDKFFDCTARPVMRSVCGRDEEAVAEFAKEWGWES